MNMNYQSHRNVQITRDNRKRSRLYQLDFQVANGNIPRTIDFLEVCRARGDSGVRMGSNER